MSLYSTLPWRSIPLVAALALAACGGGSSSSDNTNGGNDNNNGGNNPPPSVFTTINGTVMAGPVSGQVCAYTLSATGQVGGTALACTNTTPATGAYTLSIADYVGNVLLSATGTYVDEATAKTVTLNAQNALSSVIGWDVAGRTFNVAITPLTEAAIRAAKAAGGITEANVEKAMLDLARALNMDATTGEAAYDSIVGILPALSGGGNDQLAYAAFLDLFSTAQSQYCGSNGNCNLFSYLDHVLGQISSQTGVDTFRQSLQQAYTAWQAAQADAPYVCSYTGTDFTCVPNTGGNNGGNNGGTGNYNLNIVVTALGFNQAFNVNSVAKPSTQSEFCDPALNAGYSQVVSALSNTGGTFTLDSCSFNGSVGNMAATISITVLGFTQTVPYTMVYTYTGA